LPGKIHGLPIDGGEHLVIARLIVAGLHQFDRLLPSLGQILLELELLPDQPFLFRAFDFPGGKIGLGHQGRGSKHGAELFDHRLLDITRWHAFDWAVAYSALGVFLADVVGVPAVILAGVGRSHGAAAVSAADDAFEWRHHLGPGHGNLNRLVVGQDGLDFVPGFPVDDRFMFSGIALIFMGDLADVDPVVQQPVNMPGIPYEELGLKPQAGTALCQQYVKVCPGSTYCNRGQQDTLAFARKVEERFYPFPKITAKVKIGISGCFNSCAEPAIKDIGFIGLPKGWIVMVGGAGGKEPMIANIIARDLSDEQALDATGKILTYYRGMATRPQTRNLRLGVILEKEGTERLRSICGFE
jgi:hypothetical protein